MRRWKLTAVGSDNGKERAALNFLPQIKAGLVPVLSAVGEIILDDRPDDSLCGRRVSVVKQPFGVSHEGNGTQRRAIPLRTTPSTGELGQVDHVFGLAEATAVGETAGRVGHGLQLRLGDDIVLDLGLESRVVLFHESINNAFEDEGAIARPCVPVCTRSVLMPKDRLMSWLDVQSGSFLDGLATTTPGAAPEAAQPVEPMLQRRRCQAKGVCFSMKESTDRLRMADSRLARTSSGRPRTY